MDYLLNGSFCDLSLSSLWCWLKTLYPLTEPKRGLHGAAPPGARGPALHNRQNQQDRGASALLLPYGFFLLYFSSDETFKFTTTDNRTAVKVFFLLVFLFLPLIRSGAENITGGFISEGLLLSWVCFHVAGPALWGSCVHRSQPGGSAFIRTCEKWWRAVCLPAKGIRPSIYLSNLQTVRLLLLSLCLVFVMNSL